MKQKRIVFRLSTALLFGALLFATVQVGPYGHFRLINTASALARTYKLQQVFCIDSDGTVIGVGTMCAEGTDTKCTPVNCDFGD